jgi:hypothetical protein
VGGELRHEPAGSSGVIIGTILRPRSMTSAAFF